MSRGRPYRRVGTRGLVCVAAVAGALGAAAIVGTRDVRTAKLLAGTLRLACGTCAISLPVAVIMACLLVRTDVPGRTLARALLGAMLFVPLYLQAAAWDAGFGLQGWFSLWTASPAAPVLRGWQGAVWVHALAAIPWAVLIIGAGIRLVPAELEEQALLDASPPAALWHVTLPRAALSVAVAALWVLVTTAGEMTVTDLFQVRTFAEELYIGFALGDSISANGPAASPLAVGLLLAGLACLLAAALSVCALVVRPEDASCDRTPPAYRLGLWKWPATLFVGAVLLVLVGVPVGNLACKAGMVVYQVGPDRVRQWSLAKAFVIVARSPWEFRDELRWTLQIATTVAVVTALVGLPIAWLARRDSWRSLALWMSLSVCLALPGPLIALGLIHLLNQPGWGLAVFLYDRTVLAPCVALVVKALPPVTLILWYGLRSIPADVLDAAELDGAGTWRSLLCIALPQRIPAIAAGFLVAMALAMGDLAASILVVPPGVTTLAIRIFTLVHYGVEDRLAGVCVMGFIVFAGLAGITFAALKWRSPT